MDLIAIVYASIHIYHIFSSFPIITLENTKIVRGFSKVQ